MNVRQRTDAEDVFELSREELDALPYGVITLDRRGTVLRYNETEAAFARRSQERTLGTNFFADVAPCTNVQAFKGRFDVFARGTGSGVDRFDFSFAFRWGRHDVSITLLRKADHDEINVLVRGRSIAALDAPSPPAGGSRARRRADVTMPAIPAHASDRIAGTPSRLERGAHEATWRKQIHPDDAAAAMRTVEAACADGAAYAVEYRAIVGDGRVRVYLEQGAGDGAVYLLDVTEAREREAQLKREAHYDALTGLANRPLLMRRVDEAVRETTSSGRIAALLYLDLDGFKSVNDTFGHAVGDEVLRAMALRLGECVRGGDTVARIGGDEFVVLLTDLDDTPTVERTARRVLSAVSRPIEVAERRHYITASVGVSIVPHHGREAADLLRAADSAMCASKRNARNAFQWYTAEISASIAANVRTEEELRLALERGELEVHYQPIVDIERERVVAAEALVRWNHPQRGLVMPGEFITVAERSGLIAAVGEVVLREACRQSAEWTASGGDVRVCINVSTGQLKQRGFADELRAILIETGARPDRIELELTESMMIEGFGHTMDVLTELKMMGVRLAVDDFGTGYSSLAYLKYLPVDTLKLDRAFISAIAADRFDRAIATAVLSLARELKLECIAEGIETREQLETLRELGCRHIQGYLLGRPGPAPAFPAVASPPQ